MTGRTTEPVTVLLVAATDPAARDVLLGGARLELPASASVVYRHRWAGSGEGDVDQPRLLVERVIGDDTGVLWRDDLDGADGADCACCRVDADLIETLRTLADTGRWPQLLVAPPVSAPIGQLSARVGAAIATGELTGVRLGAVTAAVDLAGLEPSLFGDDLLAERDAQLSPRDRRSVGEAVAEQLEYADLAVGIGQRDRASVLLRHLAGGRVVDDWADLTAAELTGVDHDPELAARRRDPLVGFVTADPADGADVHDRVWTAELRDPRPLHPERLLARLEDLGLGRTRSRGVFWLPTRPDTPCAWDGAGGQLSVGTMSGWHGVVPLTRLVITGIDPRDRDRVRTAFDEALLSRDEWSSFDPAHWPGDDGFEPWLGLR